MTKQELHSILKQINDCEDYLDGKVHTQWVREIARAAAQRAILERKENLYERLRCAGLNLVEEHV